MKKIFTFTLSVLISSILFGCGNSNTVKPSTEETSIEETSTEELSYSSFFELCDIGFSVPYNWSYSDEEENRLFFYPDEDSYSFIMVSHIDTEYDLHLNYSEASDLFSQMLSVLQEKEEYNIKECFDSTLTPYPTRKVTGTYTADAKVYNLLCYFVMYNNDTYSFFLFSDPSSLHSYEEELNYIVENISFVNEIEPQSPFDDISDFVISRFYDEYDTLCWSVGVIYPEVYGSEGEWGPQVEYIDNNIVITVRALSGSVPDVIKFSTNVANECIHEFGARRVILNVSSYSQSNEAGIEQDTMSSWVSFDASPFGTFFDRRTGYSNDKISISELGEYYSTLNFIKTE